MLNKDEIMGIVTLHPARSKAKKLANQELHSIFKPIGGYLAKGGPLSEQKAKSWIVFPSKNLQEAYQEAQKLGYSQKIQLLQPSLKSTIIWKKKNYELQDWWEQDAQEIRKKSPDKRTFYLKTLSGQIKKIPGYRGDGTPTGRRGLPVIDARLMVNIAEILPQEICLDPFAGVGGILIAAKNSNLKIWSCDIDPGLKPGLEKISNKHIISDSSKLPYKDESVQAVVTEVPFQITNKSTIISWLASMARIVQKNRKIVLMAGPNQQKIFSQISLTELNLDFCHSLKRKKINTVIYRWTKL